MTASPRRRRLRLLRTALCGPLFLPLFAGEASAQALAAGSTDPCLSQPKCVELFQTANNLARAELNEAALGIYQTAYGQFQASWLLVNIGRIQQKLGRLPAAINSYRQYLASPETVSDPALLQKTQEYLVQAQAQVVDICLSDPKCTELNETARNFSKNGQLEAALTLYQTAYGKFPAAWLLVNIGRIQQKLGRLPEAMRSYRQYLACQEAVDDPELTRKTQEYLSQAEADFEPPPADLLPPPPPPPPPPPVSSADAEDAGTPAKGSERQRRNGFAIALGLGSRRPLVQIDGNTTAPSSSVGGSVFFGYKRNRVIFGLGLEVDYFSLTTQLVSAAGSATATQDTTSFLVLPGVQVAVLRAAAGRLELLAAAQLGLGQAITNQSASPPLPATIAASFPSRTFHLNYQIGPGLRFYAIRQFALSLTSGVAGDSFVATQDGPSGRRADTLSSVSFFGSLGALGIF